MSIQCSGAEIWLTHVVVQLLECSRSGVFNVFQGKDPLGNL